mmetsp:Transcript_8297/g.12058  ORF Transcript_8297/g.12058 Transcript_8297/m.12058 type:complete len:320 (+) Transcript_8297:86-1045(+)|eukprot:CAMPEP_0194748396 /NCGR_PEP_ID=MMETSP0323_2-20130528/2529_1 /TAXON_ID=2866 ORGANISM="Crypthecodinium cohnii, Strain Seligo" /NCGR_SAMPLE_ID=MMETSP0323_2 /ASSEMBLY_ACC=CAM_ASM_000346 /LENGTH=319 /DNA_ID=CAMNT_0039662605 /DNA_START=77 /DNA_END=1036 /DNA_ORIENTATION=+
MEQTLKLQNGLEMPVLGYGCSFGNWTDTSKWMGFEPEAAWSAIPAALRAGVRHFDAALFYDSQRVLGHCLGQAFQKGELRRSDVWITTKVGHPYASHGSNALGKSLDWTNPDIDIKQEVRKQIELCLDELMLGYVDLLLMHWPGKWETKDEALNRRLRKEVWEVMEEYYKLGKVRAVGVCNFQIRHLQTFIQDVEVKPMLNQIEVSPYITQEELVKYCQDKEIRVEAWSPFGSGTTNVLKDDLLKEIGEKHGKNSGQVVLRWLYQRGVCSLAKSSKEERMRGNLDIFDFELSEEEMSKISGLNKDQSSVGDGMPGDSIA